jgi:hypothetical protein
MCEEHGIEHLMSFNFVDLVDEVVERSLSFKVRNADPRVQPFYFRILYTWYVTHGDYRSGEPTILFSVDIAFSGSCSVPACRKQKAPGPEQHKRASTIFLIGRTTVRGSRHLLKCPLPCSTRKTYRLFSQLHWAGNRRLKRHIPEDRFILWKRDSKIVKLRI